MSRRRVLIVCSGNSVRSQMAEGLLRHLGGDTLEVHSAGTASIGVGPLAIEAMREIGIDITAHRSKSVSEFEGQRFDTVITVCDSAAEHYPVFPGAPQRIHCSITDPGAATGSPTDKLSPFPVTPDRLAFRLPP